MLPRPRALQRLHELLDAFPVVVILGPRQCGKTTLARMITDPSPAAFFDLENPVDRSRLAAPMTALQQIAGLVVLDEVQRLPALFELIRVLVDRPDNETRFLLLGSASPQLVKGVSESLAGRVGFLDLTGFDLRETGSSEQDRLWIRGGFPLAFLARDDHASLEWRNSFIRTFLERDIPQLGITVPSETLRRFWTMMAHYHGQTWNAAELARSLGASEKTARRYLDILEGAFMMRVLPPWFENVGKRQVKSPKVFLRDTGILHALLQMETLEDLRGHPRLGASWEGFAMEQVIGALETRDVYFWATHGGAELDLMVPVKGKRYGFEFKYADAPRRHRSMHVATTDLELEHLWVVYPGAETYDLDEHATVLPIASVPELADQLRA